MLTQGTGVYINWAWLEAQINKRLWHQSNTVWPQRGGGGGQPIRRSCSTPRWIGGGSRPWSAFLRWVMLLVVTLKRGRSRWRWRPVCVVEVWVIRVEDDIGGVAAEGKAGHQWIKLRRWPRKGRVQAELSDSLAVLQLVTLNSYPLNVCVYVRAHERAVKHVN